jgi:hypothetical protein
MRRLSTDRARARSFHDACLSLEAALSGHARAEIVAEVAKAKTFDRAARHLRDGMRAHRFEAPGRSLFAGSWVKYFDDLTRRDGFHALNDWDGKADRFCDDIIPVEVANHAERTIRPTGEAARRLALAILLDYYFMHLLALVALRAWDEGDPNENLDAIGRLIGLLQGPQGSGQKFASNAPGLILVATSHFEPDVTAYERLLKKVRELDARHRLDVATTHAAILGCHLRFGLEVTCAGSVAALHDDNLPDYPWLCEALATLLEAYAETRQSADASFDRGRISEALLLGLTPDPEAFLGPHPPDSLAGSARPLARIRELFSVHGAFLLRDFEQHRVSPDGYSPAALTFNFPHNLLKGIVVNALIRGVPWALSLDDLLTAVPRSKGLDTSRLSLAHTLMGYALASPDTIRGRPHPAIVYHPESGLRAFNRTLARLTARVSETGSLGTPAGGRP